MPLDTKQAFFLIDERMGGIFNLGDNIIPQNSDGFSELMYFWLHGMALLNVQWDIDCYGL